MTTVRIKGLDKAIRELRKKGDQGESIVKDYLEDVATNIEIKASQNAALIATNDPKLTPGNLNINEKIDKERSENGLRWTIFVNADPVTEPVFGWIEFGTGADYLQRVAGDSRYTDEIRKIARLFFRTGEGGLRGSPYFFPAWFAETADIVDQLKRELKFLNK